jgi:cardiolipin synthase
VATVANVLVALAASGHALLRKRDPRAAVAWVGLIWLSPVIGAVAYVLFGINRIRRKAAALQRARVASHTRAPARTTAVAAPAAPSSLPMPSGSHASPGRPGRDDAGLGDATGIASIVPQVPAPFAALAHATDRLVGLPMTGNNRVELLENGDAAYPAMLDAIARAERSVALATYIFDEDRAGARFRKALADARKRGVDVRVLIDAVGMRYSFPPSTYRLRREGVTVATFLPTFVPFATPFLNLRNHRKILVVDGKLGFTGGMNIREGHVLGDAPKHPVKDLHFRLEGPIVAQLMTTFAEDWAFTTGESLSGPTWFPPLESAGSTLARALPDGPDDDFEVLRFTLLAALAHARRRVQIMTPYFLPDPALMTAMNVAALRRVAVDVVLPAESNIKLAQWASTAMLWQILERGCRVHLTPPPFDHSKVFVVDDAWALVGSANWDPRSLRLNFELGVECYDEVLARELGALVDARIAQGRTITLAEVDARPFPIRVRDGVAKLFAPYL